MGPEGKEGEKGAKVSTAPCPGRVPVLILGQQMGHQNGCPNSFPLPDGSWLGGREEGTDTFCPSLALVCFRGNQVLTGPQG